MEKSFKRFKLNCIINPLIPGANERSHILKQTQKAIRTLTKLQLKATRFA